ncbi:(Fe-S)-binding protein [Candidatus Hydrogenedentota bacterium]
MLTLVEKLLFTAIVIGAIIWFVRRGMRLVRLVRSGVPDTEARFENPAGHVASMLADVVLQRKVFRKPVVGLLHLLIVWGFFVFAVNTINHFAGALIEGFHMFGATKLADRYDAMADIFAVLIIIGVIGLAFRRHVLRPANLSRPSPESALVFAAIGGALAAYLWVHATEIALGRLHSPSYHPTASLLAGGLENLGERSLLIMAHVAWWCDGLLHLFLVGLVVVPTKHAHLIAGPINLLFARSRNRGAMTTLDFEDEEAEAFGVSEITGFTRKQLLDLTACIECGRCQEFCPAHTSQKPLSPKQLIMDLKHHLLTNRVTQATPALIGEVLGRDTLWACTTCGACVEHCPMGIEHIDKITDMRRHLALMESDFSEEAELAFRNMEISGNPWAFPAAERAAWAKGLDVPVFAEKKKADVLYWVGCSGSYDERNKKISRAMVKILNEANVDFAILGEEERCNCESARRLGNEYLYQTATQEIIEILGQYEFNRILVTCPHCFNTFANEYPAFDARYNIVHHGEFISELLDSGKLEPAGNGGGQIVFHDSCYLSRYNDIDKGPKRVLGASGKRLVDIERQGKKGFCCGAGGGRMWLEEDLGEPINEIRAEELVTSGAEEIGTACPFCMTMISDGVKEQENIRVRDIAEIIAEQV